MKCGKKKKKWDILRELKLLSIFHFLMIRDAEWYLTWVRQGKMDMCGEQNNN
jgi:hypothetical protein